MHPRDEAVVEMVKRGLLSGLGHYVAFMLKRLYFCHGSSCLDICQKLCIPSGGLLHSNACAPCRFACGQYPDSSWMFSSLYLCKQIQLRRAHIDFR